VDETKPNQTPNQTQGSQLNEALAKFQAENTGVPKGGTVDGGPRQGGKYANLTDILKIASRGTKFGLSHSGQPRVLGDGMLVWREYLYHTSGEERYAEIPVLIPPDVGFDRYGNERKVQLGERYQTFQGLMTYARKGAITGLYGLYADDGMDPDLDSYENPEDVVAPQPSAPAPVAAPKQQQQPVVVTPDDAQTPITGEQKAAALKVVKENAEVKAAFMKQYHPSVKSGMTAKMLTLKEHHDFIVAPF